MGLSQVSVCVHSTWRTRFCRTAGDICALDKSLSILWEYCEITTFLPSLISQQSINLTFPVGHIPPPHTMKPWCEKNSVKSLLT